jgi:hypothetical protein
VAFDNAMVPTWVNNICEDAVHALVELGKPFKYIGACGTAIVPCGVTGV